MIPIIRHSKIWFSISALFVGAAVVLLVVFGLKSGIDFTGGALIELSFPSGRPALEEMNGTMEDLEHAGFLVQPSGDEKALIRTKPLADEERTTIVSSFQERFGEDVVEDRFESIGPTIGEELKQRSLYAIFAVLVAIILYISYAFRKVSGQLSSWKLGVTAIAALLHDVLITLGVFALLGKLFGVEVDSLFVTALLMVLGYSVNDTIVVFDRIRKNVTEATGNFERAVELSVNQTIVRSVNTSVTTFLVLLSLYFLGGESIKWFVMALMIGVVAGTYSSIFFASPFLVAWQKRFHLGRKNEQNR